MKDQNFESAIETAKRIGESAVDYAKRIGTFGKVDRTEQYEGELDSLDGVLLRRKLQAKYDTLFAEQRRQEKVKFRHAIVILVSSFILGNAHALYAWAAKFVQ